MLLNVTVDTVELKGILNDFDSRRIDQFWNIASRSRYYQKSYSSKRSKDIFLYVGLTSSKDRSLDFKLKIGSVALNSVDLPSLIKTTVDADVFKVGLVDIALDYSILKMSEDMFTIFKTSKQILNNKAEIIKNVERGYKFFKKDIVTGYVWGDRSRLYVRVYDKIEEIKENKNYVKEKFIEAYGSEKVFRVEFSVKGKFKDYDLIIRRESLDKIKVPGFYIPNIIEYIENKVEPGYYGKKVFADLKNISKMYKYQMSKSLRVAIDDEIQLNQGLGNIKSYLEKKYPIDKNVIKTFMDNFSTFLNNQQKYYNVLTDDEIN